MVKITKTQDGLELEHIGRKVGLLKLNKVFVTHRSPEHFFRKFNGFGISLDVAMKLNNLGCHKIIIIYHRKNGDQIAYATTPKKFIEHGKNWKDLSHDSQKILSIKEFDTI